MPVTIIGPNHVTPRSTCTDVIQGGLWLHVAVSAFRKHGLERYKVDIQASWDFVMA